MGVYLSEPNTNKDIKEGSGKVTVNGKELTEYFRIERDQQMVLAPLKMLGKESSHDVSVRVNGGGTTGQTLGGPGPACPGVVGTHSPGRLCSGQVPKDGLRRYFHSTGSRPEHDEAGRGRPPVASPRNQGCPPDLQRRMGGS